MRKRDRVKKVFIKVLDFEIPMLVSGLMTVLLLTSFDSKGEEIMPPPYHDMVGKPLSTQECLAINSYMEGRSESDIANLAIMTTVYKRSLLGGRYGSTMCEVVFKPFSYSWTNDGKSDRIRNIFQYERLYKLAGRFLIEKDKYLIDFEGVDHYHKVDYKTDWNYRKLDYVGRFDNHVFYRHK